MKKIEKLSLIITLLGLLIIFGYISETKESEIKIKNIQYIERLDRGTTCVDELQISNINIKDDDFSNIYETDTLYQYYTYTGNIFARDYKFYLYGSNIKWIYESHCSLKHIGIIE
jgi:hypothetical protein